MAGSRVSAIGALVLSCAVLVLWSPPVSAECSGQRECLQEALDLRKRLQASEAAKGNQAGVRKLQAEIDQMQRDIKGLESVGPQPVTPRAPAQPPPPVGAPPNKSTVTGIVKPKQDMPTTAPTPVKPPPAAQPDTGSNKTVREILEQQQNLSPQPQQNPAPQPATGSAPSGGQPGAAPVPGQKAGGVRLDVQSKGRAEDLDRNDVLKLLRKPGT